MKINIKKWKISAFVFLVAFVILTVINTNHADALGAVGAPESQFISQPQDCTIGAKCTASDGSGTGTCYKTNPNGNWKNYSNQNVCIADGEDISKSGGLPLGSSQTPATKTGANGECSQDSDCSSGKCNIVDVSIGGVCAAASATGDTPPPAGSNAANADGTTTPGTDNGGTTTPGGSGTGTKCEDGYESSVGGLCFPINDMSKATISKILLNLFTWLFGLFSVIAVSAFIISGIQYLTSAGNETMIETAKRNMTWSIVGVIVGLSGLVIVKAIANALQGTNPFF